MHFSAGDFFPLESQSKKGEKSDFFSSFLLLWKKCRWELGNLSLKKKQFIKKPFEHLSLFTF